MVHDTQRYGKKSCLFIFSMFLVRRLRMFAWPTGKEMPMHSIPVQSSSGPRLFCDWCLLRRPSLQVKQTLLSSLAQSLAYLQQCFYPVVSSTGSSVLCWADNCNTNAISWLLNTFPSKVHVLPDYLRSEISSSRTCNIPKLISYMHDIKCVLHGPFTA